MKKIFCRRYIVSYQRTSISCLNKPTRHRRGRGGNYHTGLDTCPGKCAHIRRIEGAVRVNRIGEIAGKIESGDGGESEQSGVTIIHNH